MEPAHQPCMGATDQDRSSPGNEGGRAGEKERRRGGERSERWEGGQGGRRRRVKDGTRDGEGGGGGEEERIGVKGGERERGRRELTCTSGISCLWRYTVDC